WSGVWGHYLSFPLWHCCHNVDIYCHHYAYRRVISLPFLRWRDADEQQADPTMEQAFITLINDWDKEHTHE
ncbi:hypothetical protein MJN51_39405, partial [Salmonella enterica subsp. enterica serovar Kentucky]|nr:hypothetical protein [Salmonella enterica subsp. enterica serovar Kentucky]